jgi:small subunit ribosomal protein S6e
VPKFKLIISDPKTGKSQVVELEGSNAQPLVGKKIGEEVDGSIANLADTTLLITGGSDKDGTPLRSDVQGGAKVKAILSGGQGYHPKEKGQRRRKLVRGNIITEESYQINLKSIDKTKPSKKANAKSK